MTIGWPTSMVDHHTHILVTKLIVSKSLQHLLIDPMYQTHC